MHLVFGRLAADENWHVATLVSAGGIPWVRRMHEAGSAWVWPSETAPGSGTTLQTRHPGQGLPSLS